MISSLIKEIDKADLQEVSKILTKIAIAGQETKRGLIQAFSRTNRIYDRQKTYGQIVTFQAPVLFKKCVDNAVKLYSAGGTKEALLAEWDEIEPAFWKALAALRVSAQTPSEVPGMSLKEKKIFAKIFQSFDKLFAQLKSFNGYG